MVDVPLELGPTEFWPRSHRLDASFVPPSAARELISSIPLECHPGDAIVFDFRVLHRGMANASPHQWRPILYQTCSRSWFIDDFNFPQDISIHSAELAKVSEYDESGKPGMRVGFKL
mmetsp:Transcript_5469/g.11466  ORF Transcript_5469/g.11466 Transcript_5469/m.11466 type:complete len:117 (+) Transcript_5469:479-829(+)